MLLFKEKNKICKFVEFLQIKNSKQLFEVKKVVNENLNSLGKTRLLNREVGTGRSSHYVHDSISYFLHHILEVKSQGNLSPKNYKKYEYITFCNNQKNKEKLQFILKVLEVY